MIGQILVTRKIITPEQLQQALQQQRAHGTLLGDVLLEMGMVSEDSLAQVLASEARVPYLAPGKLQPDPAVAGLIPETFARKHLVAALTRAGGGLRVVQANPFDVLAIDELERRLGTPVEVVSSTRSAVSALLGLAFGQNSQLRALVEEAVAALSQPDRDVALTEAPIVRIIENLLNDAVHAGATDLHLEPDENLVRLRHRVDGVLTQVDTLPRILSPALVSRLKVMAGLDIAEQRLPQEGRITQTLQGRSVDMRVSSFPTVFGEKVAIRILEKEKLVRPLEQLGLTRRNLVHFQDLLSKSRGIILVTGPTGAGKTTTLYSALNYLGGREKNIMTVEDPVEYEFSTIRQTQIRPKAGLTFATAIRSLLRQDPDVIMIGEIRDPETAQLAVRAALSGVLVFSTLHTQDTAGAVPRLMDMGVEPYLLASAVVGVVAQRLLRVLCPHCKEPTVYDAELLAKVSLTVGDSVTFYRGKGCSKCGNTGYRGRIGAFEILPVDESVHEAIRARSDSRLIKESAVRGGMRTLLDDALSKAVFGQTSLEEVLRIAYE
jgi:type IV pilus assembly protein PilB